MRRFVVTGCNGYIGSHMCYELKKAFPDCWIHGVDRVEKQHLRPLYDIFSHTDLALDPIILSPFERKPIDAIFHFAALTSVEEGEMRPFQYYDNNVTGSMRLIREALTEKVPNFIFSSTAAVYGEWESPLFGHLIEDKHKMKPLSVYGKSKAIVEQMLEGVEGMNVVRLRYFNACGRNVEAGLFEEHDPETHLIPILAKSKKAVIYGDDWSTSDGTCIRDYVHVVDICRAHVLAYLYMRENNINEVFNVGTGNGYSVKQVVNKVNDVIHNGEMEIEYQPRRQGDVAYLVADSTKIRKLLGWTPQYDLHDIVESMKEI